MNVFLTSSSNKKKIGSQLLLLRRQQCLLRQYRGSSSTNNNNNNNILLSKITLLSSSSSSSSELSSSSSSLTLLLSSFWYHHPTISSTSASSTLKTLRGVNSSSTNFYFKPINQTIISRRYFSSQQQQDDNNKNNKNNNNLDDPTSTSSSTQKQQQQKQPESESYDDDDHHEKSKSKSKLFDHLPPLESANPDRIRGIKVDPDSIGYTVLPGNLVYKYYKFTGNTRKIPLELTHGYFWMIKDLQKTNSKPTLSNDVLIPKEDRQLFPTLHGLKTLNNEKADLPYFFIHDKQQHKDPNSQNNNCTLVSISFRDSGFKNISTWTKPFEDVFINANSNNNNNKGNNKGNNNPNNVQSYTISITERGSLSLLKGFLANVMKNNTPTNEYDTTLLYFNGWGQTDVDEFRDVLRMHNIMTNYVFLLDNLGCIRFAGSGAASDEDISRLIRFTKELTTESSKSNNNSKTKIKKNNNRKKRGGTK